jgi:hypothetical protein
MSIQLNKQDLINTQQMEVAVRGPDGATHLILCTGIACLASGIHETYTFLVGPQLSRRQFVGVIAWGAFSRLQTDNKNSPENQRGIGLGADLLSIDANYDGDSGQVKVRVEVSSSSTMTKLSISYSVSILAELPMY